MTATADDLDALFDEISAQRTEAIITPAAVAKPQPQSVAVAHAPQESQTDKPMFDRLGGIVRMLHDSMRELGYDRALNDVASQITDAQGRLEYVATLTEQAANKVLNATEAGMPEQE